MVLLFALFCWPLIRGNAATANYDFITSCCLVVLFIESYIARPSPLTPEGILWPCFLFTVRMVNAPILLYALFLFILLQKRDKRTWLLFLPAGAFLIIPFIWRNFLLSGYPFYPIYQLAPFHADWQVSRALLVKIADYNTHFNRGDLETSRLPFPGWVPAWYGDQPFYNEILLAVMPVCWLIVLARWKRNSGRFPLHYRLLMAFMIVQICSWLYVAPDPRFVYGVLLSSLFAGMLSLPLTLTRQGCKRIMRTGLFVMSGFLFIYTTRKVFADPDYRNGLLPHALPVPVSRDITVDHLVLHIPDKVLDNWNPRCYDLPLPCLYIKNPYLRARGKNIRDGFRLDNEMQPQKEDYIFQ